MATESSERRDSSHDEDGATAIPTGVIRSLRLQVPSLVTTFIDYLMQEASRKLGIFRVSVSKRRVLTVNSSLSNIISIITFQLYSFVYIYSHKLKYMLNDVSVIILYLWKYLLHGPLQSGVTFVKAAT